MLSNVQRENLFGSFKFAPDPTPENPERIKVFDDWRAQNLAELHLTGIEPAVGPDDAWVHKKMQPHLEELLLAWQEAGLSSLVLTWNGCYAPRFKRGRAPTAAELAVPGVLSPGVPGVISTSGEVVRRLTLKGHNLLLPRLSAHSWGTAFDINARWNGLGMRPAAPHAKGTVWPLVPIAESLGWIWGGRWKTPDGMHFEWSRT